MKLAVCFVAFCLSGFSQSMQTVNNETFPGARAKINSNFAAVATKACVGTPGNTTGAYMQGCQDASGYKYACNNAAGCTVAADWFATSFATATVAQGGTGLSTLAIHALYVGNTTSAPTALAVGATDKPLVGVTGANPVFSKLTLTNPATAATLTIADNKSLTVSNIMTLAGTDSQTYTFPATSATMARTDAANTFTGVQTMTSPVLTTPNLGTPSALVLTNATGLPAAQVPPTPVITPGATPTLVGPRGIAICTGTCTVTVPVPVAGYEFCIYNDDNVSTAITLSALGTGAMYENSARTAYGTAGIGTLVLSAAAANKVCIVGRDATHYLTSSYNGAVTVN